MGRWKYRVTFSWVLSQGSVKAVASLKTTRMPKGIWMPKLPTRWFREHGAWLVLATIYHPKILNFKELTDQGKMGVDETGHECAKTPWDALWLVLQTQSVLELSKTQGHTAWVVETERNTQRWCFKTSLSVLLFRSRNEPHTQPYSCYAEASSFANGRVMGADTLQTRTPSKLRDATQRKNTKGTVITLSHTEAAETSSCKII